MQSLIGQGVIAAGIGEVALYSDWLTSNDAKVIATASSGSPIGMIVDEKNPDSSMDIKIIGDNGIAYYSEYDPSIFKLVNYNPGQSVNTDTSWFTDTGSNNSTLTFTSGEINPNSGQVTAVAITPSGQTIAGLKRIKKSYDWLYIGGTAVLISIIALILKHKTYAQ